MMDPEEKKRAKQLMKEQKKAEEKLDWMYKKNLNPDSEDYLLGRKIDKIFEQAQEDEEPGDKNAPGAIFNERIKANIAMDMAAKMREDPLFQIRKREEDAKKQLLQNPVKMKQLEKLVKDKQKGKHKKKKKKERKKKNRGNSSDSDDDEIMKKYLAVLSKKHISEETSSDRKKKRDHGEKDESKHRDKSSEKNKRHQRDRHKSSSGSPVKSPMGHRDHKHEEQTKNGSRRKSHNSDSEDDKPKPQKQYGLVIKGHANIRHQNRSLSKSPKRKSRSPKTKSPKKRSRSPNQKRNRSRSPVKRNRSPARGSRSPVRRARSPVGKSKSPRRKSRSPTRRSRSPVVKRSAERSRRRSRSRSPVDKAVKRKLTDDEKRRRLEEMQENAKWRDEQREKNVKRYKAETEQEERSHLRKGSSSDFINPLMESHVSKSSVADRIKRNIYNVQRTKADLDKDFMKR